jgi:organic radical activating enzyme
MKGDVPIMSVNDGDNVTLSQIIDKKTDIINKINDKQVTGCFGCPLLKYKEWKDVESEQFDIISIENHSRCNMKCSYCSDVYYGGEEPKYDLISLLNEVVQQKMVANNIRISWGGGEPTIMRGFEDTVDFVTSHLNPKTQRFFSNAINFSDKIAKLLLEDKASITTSIDAGTIETFKKVRGVNQFKKVMKNVKKYFDISPNNIVIKYIFTDENSSINEIVSFVEEIRSTGLSEANFIISCNFKSQFLTGDISINIMYLQYLLLNNGAKTCVLDEHTRPRISKLTKDILNNNESLNLPNEVAEVIREIKSFKNKLSTVLVWGVGEYTNFILDESETFRDSKVSLFVDSDVKKQGIKFRGLHVYPPEEILKHEGLIIIASSFWYHEIIDQLADMGVDSSRIVPSYII